MISHNKAFMGIVLFCAVSGILFYVFLNGMVPGTVYIQKNLTVFDELNDHGFDIVPLPTYGGAGSGNPEDSVLNAKTAFVQESGRQGVYYYLVAGQWRKLAAINEKPSFRALGVEILSGDEVSGYSFVDNKKIGYNTHDDIFGTSVCCTLILFVILLSLMGLGEQFGYVGKACC